MKNRIHLFSAIGIAGMFCSQGLAAPVASQRLNAIPGQPISYIHSLPSAITKRMPRGARSCFFGALPPNAGATPALIHLFDPSPTQNSTKNSNSYKLVLHILNKQGQLVNVVHIGYPSKGTGGLSTHARFAAQLLWLDPAQHRKPIIKLDIFGYGTTGEPLGDHVIVSFPEGLQYSASVQGFSFGFYSGSGTLAEYATFNHIDAQGLLEIHASAFFDFELQGKSPEAKWILRWDGSKFAAINDPLEGVTYPPAKPMW
jgi:hypothetical protein